MKPILFNTEMVNAILSGRKTVTRRVVKDPYYIEDEEVSRASGLAIHKGTNTTHGMPYPDSPYRSGDILYVRETWSTKLSCSCKMDETSVCPYESCENPSGPCFDDIYIYKATDSLPQGLNMKWRPSINMPKEAARIFLRVTSVKVERLQDIDGAGQRAEGADSKHGFGATRGAFMDLWNSTVKPSERNLYGWDASPWVWVIEFERCEKPQAESVS